MSILNKYTEAATAGITVEHSVSWTNPANTTFIAVKDSFLLRFIVVKSAYVAVVQGEVLSTFNARVRFRLHCFAPQAFYMGDLVPIHLVILLRV